MDLSRFTIPASEPDAVLALIARRRRQVLVHCAIYYLYDDALISDTTYDEWAQDLDELQRAHAREAAAAPYAKEFEGFVPSTGFDLPYTRPEIQRTAERLLRDRDKRRSQHESRWGLPGPSRRLPAGRPGAADG